VSESDEAAFSDPTPGSIEDRTEARYGVDCTVTVNSDNNFYAGFVRNLSEGGIFIATHIVHPVGTKFDLSIHLHDGEEGVVRGIGEVRWIRAADADSAMPAGLGIRFISLEGDGSERVERFLNQRDPMEVSDSKLPPHSGG
jgi:uncharacterized protein (TIGR02266 family)